MYQPPKHGTVANVVPAGDFQHIKAQLEDTQESLAAAFARIEVFRLREKVLLAELAKLRIGGQLAAAAAPAADASAPDGPAVGAAVAGTAAHSAVADSQQQSSGETDKLQPRQPEKQQQEEQQLNWPLPCYVTEVEGHLPVMLISSVGRKVRAKQVCCSEPAEWCGFSCCDRYSRHMRLLSTAKEDAYRNRRTLASSRLLVIASGRTNHCLT